uniref:Tyrosine-protein kinase ephrin type A/B receptor-like domain-containing protein n=1 Tax=Oxyrrhis marina TaxID=2969 RepID=A0A7S4GPA0_OXYMA
MASRLVLFILHHCVTGLDAASTVWAPGGSEPFSGAQDRSQKPTTVFWPGVSKTSTSSAAGQSSARSYDDILATADPTDPYARSLVRAAARARLAERRAWLASQKPPAGSRRLQGDSCSLDIVGEMEGKIHGPECYDGYNITGNGTYTAGPGSWGMALQIYTDVVIYGEVTLKGGNLYVDGDLTVVGSLTVVDSGRGLQVFGNLRVEPGARMSFTNVQGAAIIETEQMYVGLGSEISAKDSEVEFYGFVAASNEFICDGCLFSVDSVSGFLFSAALDAGSASFINGAQVAIRQVSVGPWGESGAAIVATDFTIADTEFRIDGCDCVEEACIKINGHMNVVNSNVTMDSFVGCSSAIIAGASAPFAEGEQRGQVNITDSSVVARSMSGSVAVSSNWFILDRAALLVSGAAAEGSGVAQSFTGARIVRSTVNISDVSGFPMGISGPDVHVQSSSVLASHTETRSSGFFFGQRITFENSTLTLEDVHAETGGSAMHAEELIQLVNSTVRAVDCDSQANGGVFSVRPLIPRDSMMQYVFNATDATISAIGTSAVGLGGVLDVFAGVHLERSVLIMQNVRSESGGGIYADGDLEVGGHSELKFTNGTAVGAGGALLVRRGLNVQPESLVEVNNCSARSGGGIFAVSLTVEGQLSVIGARSGEIGGAAEVQGAFLVGTAGSVVVSDASAGLDGGGIRAARVDVHDGGRVSFAGTRSGAGGGALSCGPIVLHRNASVQIENSYAAMAGGGLSGDSLDVSPDASLEIVQAIAGGEGGGMAIVDVVQVRPGGTLIVRDTVADSAGGSMHVGALLLSENATAEVSNGSAVASYGGCIFAGTLESNATLLAVSDCDVGASGGGVFVRRSLVVNGALRTTRTRAKLSGGSVFVAGGNTKVASLEMHTVLGPGAAVAVTAESIVHLTSVELIGAQGAMFDLATDSDGEVVVESMNVVVNEKFMKSAASRVSAGSHSISMFCDCGEAWVGGCLAGVEEEEDRTKIRCTSCPLPRSNNRTTSRLINSAMTYGECACPFGTRDLDPSRPSIGASCELCPTGEYGPRFNASTCDRCPLGRYSSAEGIASPDDCRMCEAGRASAVLGAKSADDCELCPLGTSAGEPGQSACSECPGGRFGQIRGLLECERCTVRRPFSTAPPGSTASEDCTCIDGYYRDFAGAGLPCEPCPPGGKCSNDTVVAQPGFFMAGTTLASRCSLLTPHGSVCLGGAAFGDEQRCRTGHRGFLCGSCLEGYSRKADYRSCDQKCADFGHWVNSLLAILGLDFASTCVAYVMAYLAIGKSDNPAFSTVWTTVLLRTGQNWLVAMSAMRTLDLEHVPIYSFLVQRRVAATGSDEEAQAVSNFGLEWPGWFRDWWRDFVAVGDLVSGLAHPRVRLTCMLMQLEYSTEDAQKMAAWYWLLAPAILSAHVLVLGLLLKFVMSPIRELLRSRRGSVAQDHAQSTNGSERYGIVGLFRQKCSFRGFLDDLLPIIFVALWVNRSTVMNNFQELLHCQLHELEKTGPTGRVIVFEQRYASELDFVCFEGAHVLIAWLAGIGIGVWVAGACLLIAYLCFRSIEKRGLWHSLTRRRFGYFIIGLEPSFWWWELLVKRVDVLLISLVAGSSFAPDDKAKVILHVGLATVFWLAQLRCRPFVKEHLALADELETMALVVRLVTFGVLALVLIVDPPRAASTVIAVCVVLLNCFYLAVLGCHFVSQFTIRLARKPVEKSELKGSSSFADISKIHAKNAIADLHTDVREMAQTVRLVREAGQVAVQSKAYVASGLPRWRRAVGYFLRLVNRWEEHSQATYLAWAVGDFYYEASSCGQFPERGFEMLALLASTVEEFPDELSPPARRRQLLPVLGSAARALAGFGRTPHTEEMLDRDRLREVLLSPEVQDRRHASPEQLRRAVIVLGSLSRRDQVVLLQECAAVLDQGEEDVDDGPSAVDVVGETTGSTALLQAVTDTGPHDC